MASQSAQQQIKRMRGPAEERNLTVCAVSVRRDDLCFLIEQTGHSAFPDVQLTRVRYALLDAMYCGSDDVGRAEGMAKQNDPEQGDP